MECLVCYMRISRLSARKIRSQKFFYFLQVSPFIHFIFLSYAFTIDSYDLSYAFPLSLTLQEQESDLIGVWKARLLLVQTSQERVLVIEVALEVKVLPVIGALTLILLGRLDKRIHHPLRGDLLIKPTDQSSPLQYQLQAQD